MQTLKTAAIVVLLMTIIYGAYVSLTTPPVPLPTEVEEMLVMSEQGDFAIESGLPESLGELAINSESNPGTPVNDLSELGLASLDLPAGSADSLAQADASFDTSVSGSLSDDSVSLSGGTVISDQVVDASVATDLPPASSSPMASYPNTGRTFSLPDPAELAVQFQTASSTTPSLPTGASDLSAGSENPLPAQTPPIASPPISSPAATAPGTGGANIGVANAIRTADRQFGEDKLKEALATLTLFYNTPNLSGEQRTDLLTRLDPLAREVIYSKRHLLEQPYRVGQNETLLQVAARYEVPWQLLANINQINDPVTVLPGTELKVVRGPFRAEVDLVQKELTLFLGDLYAGRFPIGVGNDPAPKPGTFTVQDKQNARVFYGATGSPIPPGDPNNPYGNAWLDLGGQICIHGSPSTTSPTDKGCISLAADYAEDLYGILTQGSSVTIRR